ncbi:MAG: hypothetical protein AAGI88_23615 [Pseudomonadota bacterium]
MHAADRLRRQLMLVVIHTAKMSTDYSTYPRFEFEIEAFDEQIGWFVCSRLSPEDPRLVRFPDASSPKAMAIICGKKVSQEELWELACAQRTLYVKPHHIPENARHIGGRFLGIMLNPTCFVGIESVDG